MASMHRLLLDFALGVFVLELGVAALVIVLAVIVHLPALV